MDQKVVFMKTSHLCPVYPRFSDSMGTSIVFELLHNPVTCKKLIKM